MDLHQKAIDMLVEAEANNELPLDVVESLLRQIHELKRTRSEAEADALAVGRQQGRRDLQQELRIRLGLT